MEVVRPLLPKLTFVVESTKRARCTLGCWRMAPFRTEQSIASLFSAISRVPLGLSSQTVTRACSLPTLQKELDGMDKAKRVEFQKQLLEEPTTPPAEGFS